MSDADVDADGADEDQATPPDQAPPKEAPAAKRPITLSEMALVIVEEAMRRQGSAKAIEKVFGADHAPTARRLREIEVLHATARFLDTLVPILPDIRRLLKPAKKTK